MNKMDEAQARLEQRLLAIEGIELVARSDPADLVTSPPAPSPGVPKAELMAERGEGKKAPSRALLFSRVWLGFGVDDDPEKAGQVFEKKFGHKPEFVHRDLAGKMLWVGPV